MKYMGSKSRIAKDILPIILKDRKVNQCYVEPFAGGCNMIDKVDGLRLANDFNFYLIEMWKDLVSGFYEPRIYQKEEYIQIRDNKEKYRPGEVGYVGFNCSYSGKWFGGFAGEIKTKINTIRNYQQEAIKNIKQQIPKLKDVVFQNKSYDELDIPNDSIIYCDIPYFGTTGYKDKFNHSNFWNWVREKSKKHKIFISEYSAPDDFECIWSKEVKSSLSANGKIGGNKNSVEKLFVLKK